MGKTAKNTVFELKKCLKFAELRQRLLHNLHTVCRSLPRFLLLQSMFKRLKYLVISSGTPAPIRTGDLRIRSNNPLQYIQGVISFCAEIVFLLCFGRSFAG